MAGPEAERFVIRVQGTREDLRKALAVRRLIALVELNRILIFLVETQRAFGAVDLVGIAHLAARCDAAGENVAHDAALEPDHQLRLVVIGDGLGAVGAGAGFVDGFNLGDHRADGAGNGQGGIDRVRRQIAHVSEGAAPGPPIGLSRCAGEKILRKLPAKVDHLADLAGCDDFAGELRSWCADVVESGHVDGTACLGRSNHLMALVQ